MQDILNGKRILLAALAIVAFIVVNALANQAGTWKLDMTEDKLYTLSEGTERLLDKQETPVELQFYYSSNLGEEIPTYGTYAGRVRDMLESFEAASGGQVTVKEINPEPFSEAEDAAVEAGMEGVPLDVGGDKVYLGLAGTAEGVAAPEDAPVIPFFQPERERFLEYDIAKLVHSLANPERPTVGVINGAQVFGPVQAMMQGGDPQPWAAIKQAQDFFKLERIFSPEHFQEYDPDLLLVIHPHKLNPDMQYAVDQYMMRRGRAVFFMDPWFETAASRRGGTAPSRSETAMDKLFDKWGLEIAPEKFAADKTLGRKVNAGKQGQVYPAPYVAWLEPKAGQMDRSDAVIADVEKLLIPSAGVIRLKEGSPLEMTPLITTTKNAQPMDVAQLQQPDVTALLEAFKPGNEPLTLAARLTGSLETAFPDGAPEKPEDEENDGTAADDAAADTKADAAGTEEPAFPKFRPHVAKSAQNANILLFSDADMLTDRFWVRVSEFFGQRVMMPFGDNGAVLVNALENLSGSGDLIALRSRGTGQRPFTRIADLREAAEAQYRTQERALSQQLQETEKKLQQLRGGGAEDGALETEETEKTIEAFTQKMLETRKQLRAVNHKLRQNIERLEARLKFVNIAAVPLAVALTAFGVAWVRRQRRRRRGG